ncbi:UDP-3-O-(3-hydroxymyristoyl)glucosamine N-acyltransferase [Wenzhouxiangella marina]|uniref:UDP-3-O-acylglucosamine N-acyltransferase n=1 Tax=Wenzhouxiangella marina TaxID=1579979 RepID=A0A0K0XSX2_9GAMM|nr:UDP-3-O-(3-hydroxymyristoyl)glucosamine N-acyltransferase [Wenzhouxiangella marina]AKS40814.1 UDP-3-O-acylglucosamine N-acyltransferase [Wenzhouxiangella marina]MBB6087688.1 UDP-3-O-[3-hydroxymyristoyl] glucosamine N-acyltransferase [Wenzhouxiangella marina]
MTHRTLGELAERFELELRGDAAHRIRGLATLAAAGPEDLAFLANPAYIGQLADTRAGAVIVAADQAERCPGNALISRDPYVAWAHIAAHLNPAPAATPGRHPSAVVADSASVDPSASIGAQVSIGEHCRIGPRAIIGPGCVLEDDAEIGADCRLVAQVFIGRECRLDERVLIHPGVVIGADGFGLAFERDHWIKVPQMGRVRIGADCEIGANTTIDRGAIEDTVLEEDVRLDNQVQIAHNVRIGAHTAIAGCTGIAGSTSVGRYCMIAGACGIAGHLQITDKVVITAMSTVLESITEPGQYGSGIPARPQRQWQRVLVRLGQLDGWFRRLRSAEKSIDGQGR